MKNKLGLKILTPILCLSYLIGSYFFGSYLLNDFGVDVLMVILKTLLGVLISFLIIIPCHLIYLLFLQLLE